MDEQLRSKFQEHMRSTVRWISLLLVIATAFFAAALLSYLDIIFKISNLGFVAAVLLEIGAIIGVLVVFIPYFLDYRLMRSRSYLVLTVVVSRFDFYWSGTEPAEEIWFPVFEDIHSGKTLKIKVDEKVEVGEKYAMAYLPRTKIYVLKKIK